MKRKNTYWLLAISCLFAITFFSCKKKESVTVYMGYDYFPNKVGHYVIYQCDSIVVNPFKATVPRFDTFKYQIKEVIDSIYNSQGQTTQLIIRYKRTDTTIPWSNILTIEKRWTGSLLSNMATRLEDNNNYIKLVFPMSLNETWNGNAQNTIGTWNYQYITLNTPATVNGHTFDSTLTVFQQKDSSFLSYQYYFEQYAAGIGLINKVVRDYGYTSVNLFSIPPPIDSLTYGTYFYSETFLSSGNQ